MAENTRTYAPEEVREASRAYFGGDDLPAGAFTDKYALKWFDGNGKPHFIEQTPDDMHWRLAAEFARIELKLGYPHPVSAGEWHALFQGFHYIVPQGSVMYGAGNPYVNVSLSNCVTVASPQDSLSDRKSVV
jgi:ribonucleoside-diphosphate reductase alpha chain